jgi:predicted regulator of Ras-like GTPase activity (Roadblock/LC7/MglB family)
MNIASELQRAARSAAETLHGLSGVVAVVVASADGFDIASSTSGGIDAARVAAMASSISAIGSVAAQEGRLSRCRQVTVGTDDGFVYVSAVTRNDGEFVINVIADNRAILAQVAYSTAEQVRALEAA